MNKEQVIASIKQRILDEQKKHKTLDWAEIAARKIYSTHLVKELKLYSFVDYLYSIKIVCIDLFNKITCSVKLNN